MQRKRLVLTLVVAFLPAVLFGQGNKVFSIPIQDLKKWSEDIVVSISNVTITGNSKVHAVANDCELHFGAKVKDYKGDPDGWVLEPMNVCLEPFPGKVTYKAKDWLDFAASLKNKVVKVEGVPRIWPEHLLGKHSASNPNHAVELHPLTRITFANKKYDFIKDFIYAPEGFDGISYQTAKSILIKTKVGVTKVSTDAEIDFASGRIGNFAVVNVRFHKDSISVIGGSHRIRGQAVLDEDTVLVVVVSVKNSQIDDSIEKFRKGKRTWMSFSALVLFSLDPQAIYEAVEGSAEGDRTVVGRPIQLIVYGGVD